MLAQAVGAGGLQLAPFASSSGHRTPLAELQFVSADPALGLFQHELGRSRESALVAKAEFDAEQQREREEDLASAIYAAGVQRGQQMALEQHRRY